jgi:hypothetical protein
MLSSDRLPLKAIITHDVEMDDDKIEFEFGEPDSAVGPFRVPSKPTLHEPVKSPDGSKR